MAESYLNNPRLKAANNSQDWTQDQIEEWIKCSKDPIYFIRKYVKIVTLDKGFVPMDPWDYQERLLQTMYDNRFVIGLTGRQQGKSVCSVMFLLHQIIFNKECVCGLLANKASTARELLSRVKRAYESLPRWIQQGVVSWNKGDIELENGSKIIAAATSSSAIRGFSLQVCVLDEFAFVPENIADEFFTSVFPTISSGQNSKLIIVSTPNGYNHFYKMYNDAKNGTNQFKPFFANWRDVPGRDENWKKEQLEIIGAEKFDQEYEGDFLASSNTLININKIRALSHNNPIHETEGLKIYEKPIQDHTYAATVDVSEGGGADYSVMNIFDVTQFPYRQVAVYRSNLVNPVLFPDVIFGLATQYNEAYVLIELNSVGMVVANGLWNDLEYTNLLTVGKRGAKGQVLGGGSANTMQFGVKTTKVVKKTGCSLLKSSLENDQFLVQDFDTIRELTTFVMNGKGSFEADSGSTDDIAMTLVIFAWMCNQTFFKDLVGGDLSLDLKEKRNKDIMDDMIPFGFFDNGITTTNPELSGWSEWKQ